MVAGKVEDVLFGGAPVEVPLSRAPLVMVICQVRFAEILSISDQDFIASFQEKVRPMYPVLERQQGQSIEVRPDGVQVRKEESWLFKDADRQWTMTLAPSHITLQTTKYASRTDLIRRMRKVLDASSSSIEPALATRVGVRYVDRLHGESLNKIDNLINPQIMGMTDPVVRSHVKQSVSQAVCETAEGELLLRWGWMPANGSHDPAAMPMIPERSWMLDVDSYNVSELPFDAAKLSEAALTLATRAYTFFRWCVTPSFLAEYGADS